MGKRIETWIKRAEEDWLHELYANAQLAFTATFLPSHDHTHHLRVWNICKRLLSAYHGRFGPADEELAEGLLIAAFFHDLGMIRSTGEEHGRLGREMCEDWFVRGKRRTPERFAEILDAIEQHDRKGGAVTEKQGPGALPGIPEILSLADDMEAMGTIGVYRYTEIYLQRDPDLRTLGNRVLKNAFARYGKMTGSCDPFPGVLPAWHSQYRTLISFFNHYNQHLMAAGEAENVFHGHLGVVNWIRSFSVEGKVAPPDFLVHAEADGAGTFVMKFFRNLHNELEKARN